MKFGLIGYPLSHSLSPAFFAEKFRLTGHADFNYTLLPARNEEEIQAILRGSYFGLNVTIPYKSAIITFLNDIDPMALQIGAVNTIVRTGQYSWKGFNTDVTGFTQSLKTWYGLNPLPEKALVLGSGGSAKAVCYGLSLSGIDYAVVSRGDAGDLTYTDLSAEILRRYKLIINTTPLGMIPDIMECPSIPYEWITPEHRVFDLIYNPPNTLFLSRSEAQGAIVRNGLDMLYRQAEQAWAIWKSYGKF